MDERWIVFRASEDLAGSSILQGIRTRPNSLPAEAQRPSDGAVACRRHDVAGLDSLYKNGTNVPSGSREQGSCLPDRESEPDQHGTGWRQGIATSGKCWEVTSEHRTLFPSQPAG